MLAHSLADSCVHVLHASDLAKFRCCSFVSCDLNRSSSANANCFKNQLFEREACPFILLRLRLGSILVLESARGGFMAPVRGPRQVVQLPRPTALILIESSLMTFDSRFNCRNSRLHWRFSMQLMRLPSRFSVRRSRMLSRPHRVALRLAWPMDYAFSRL